MKRVLLISIGALFASNAFATLIDFNELSVGDILANQYAGQGVTFTAGHTPVAGLTAPTGGFATNTSMDVVSSTGTDVGSLGSPNLVSGNMIHGFTGYLNEDDDPSFTITFTNAISAISLDFAGISALGVSGLYAVSGGTVVASATAGTAGQATVSLAGLNVTEVVVLPGSFNDWVGVDNLNYTDAVPEPVSMFVIGGMALAALSKRRKK